MYAPLSPVRAETRNRMRAPLCWAICCAESRENDRPASRATVGPTPAFLKECFFKSRIHRDPPLLSFDAFKGWGERQRRVDQRDRDEETQKERARPGETERQGHRER